MSRIFISHSSKDGFATVAIGDWLKEEGWDDVFLDVDPDRGMHAGERWERALYDRTSECEAVLFLVSRNWLSSEWCRREYDLARKLNKRVFIVMIEDMTVDDLPASLKETRQAVSLAAGEDHRVIHVKLPVTHEEGHVTFSREGLARLKNGLVRAALDPRFFAWPPTNEVDRAPYRGFDPLDGVDAGIFFGRERRLSTSSTCCGVSARREARAFSCCSGHPAPVSRRFCAQAYYRALPATSSISSSCRSFAPSKRSCLAATG